MKEGNLNNSKLQNMTLTYSALSTYHCSSGAGENGRDGSGGVVLEQLDGGDRSVDDHRQDAHQHKADLRTKKCVEGENIFQNPPSGG